MTHLAADASVAHTHAAPPGDILAPRNITLAPGAGRGLSMALFVIAAIGLGVTVLGGFMLENGLRHALAAYHVGAMSVLAMSLGGLFFVMTFHLTQAGWTATLRRQFEHLMSLTPLAVALVLPVLIIEVLRGGVLFEWLTPHLAEHDVLLDKKDDFFLNPTLFFLRAAIYAVVWSFLARKLWWYSREQDHTGDKWLSNKARFTSAWGMLVFALATAFAAFDWLMSLDFRFFSTMWGVYYFAGAAFSSVPLVVLIVAALRRAGKLEGAVTAEHVHDLGKLMFTFTVFWAYIGFSQYFLIWYSNIPEETTFYIARKDGGWQYLTTFLVVGHFIVPFLILLWKFMRRNYALLALMALWAIFMEVVDIYWIVRPMVYAHEFGDAVAQAAAGGPVSADPVKFHLIWLDVAGAIGVLALYGAFLVRRIAKGPLVAVNDPRMPEALHHRNYV